MTDIGRIIRDAWVFGILPEDETCEGWDLARIQGLYDNVAAAWEPYGHLVSNLTPELRERHARIHAEAVVHARQAGWNPELDEESDL
jgi:hypothetical protein